MPLAFRCNDARASRPVVDADYPDAGRARRPDLNGPQQRVLAHRRRRAPDKRCGGRRGATMSSPNRSAKTSR